MQAYCCKSLHVQPPSCVSWALGAQLLFCPTCPALGRCSLMRILDASRSLQHLWHKVKLSVRPGLPLSNLAAGVVSWQSGTPRPFLHAPSLPSSLRCVGSLSPVAPAPAAGPGLCSSGRWSVNVASSCSVLESQVPCLLVGQILNLLEPQFPHLWNTIVLPLRGLWFRPSVCTAHFPTEWGSVLIRAELGSGFPYHLMGFISRISHTGLHVVLRGRHPCPDHITSCPSGPQDFSLITLCFPQWCSTRAIILPGPPPQRTLGSAWRVLWLSQLGVGRGARLVCYRYLVGEGIRQWTGQALPPRTVQPQVLLSWEVQDLVSRGICSQMKWQLLLSGGKNVVGGTYAKSALVDKFSEKKTKTSYRKNKISGDFSWF